ncbi:MAG: hypothetical protein ACE145_21630 [Terriglobia bacterium]
MNVCFLDEPELEFGAGKHVDIRFGVANYGPLDFDSPLAPRQIKVGIIGSPETVEGVQRWLIRCRTGIAAKPSKQPNLFPKFPGFTSESSFRSAVLMDTSLCRYLYPNSLKEIDKLGEQDEKVKASVTLFMEEIRYLAENTKADVIVCAVPVSILQAVRPTSLEEDEHEELPMSTGASQLDFHDMLKAAAMKHKRPIQLVLPSTYDESKHRKLTLMGFKRKLQDEATRAWNIHSAFYYKAGGLPWRLIRDAAGLSVCHIGITFFNSLDGKKLHTSVAQVFNERGEGVVVQGAPASLSKEDRQPHLAERDAYQLLWDALQRYRDHHFNFPARVVVHKSSVFDQNEQSGFEGVLRECHIELFDFISMTDSYSRLFRGGAYPPLRGTLLALDESTAILYTRGSVSFFETYPGKYVPVPLLFRSDRTSETQRTLAYEILALTKMNWNNTQFDGSEPLTIRAARQVKAVLRYCGEGDPIEPAYSFYM